MTQLPHLAALAALAFAPLGAVAAESQATAVPYGSTPVMFSAAAPLAAPVAPKGTKAKVEEVEIKTQDKQALQASFYPSRKSGRAPAVLLVHDAGSDRSKFESTAESLQKRGFAVLALDLRGHGSSVTEDFNWIKAAEEEQAKLWAFAMRDLDAATDFLRERDDVHNSNLSLVGVGAGAALATKYALRDENARAVVLIDPQPEAYGYDMYQDVYDLGGLPTMILAPSADRRQAERLQSAANEGNNGVEYVQFKVLKPKKGEGPLTDKRLPKNVTDFLRDEAMESR